MVVFGLVEARASALDQNHPLAIHLPKILFSQFQFHPL
jgi:hypothetical protein